VFTVEERDRVRERLLSLAEADPAIGGAAIIGSYAAGGGDRWSDIDLALRVDGPPHATMERWTESLYGDFAAVHHWDLPAGSTIYRVFLLPGWLEVDLAFAPTADYGPRGPHWRVVFDRPQPQRAGEREPTAQAEPTAGPAHRGLVGLAWHHALHAHVCIERRRAWQAEYWIGAVRSQVIALACLRLGHPTAYAKGAHLLPAELTAPLEATLVRSLDAAELRRALAAAIAALAAEWERTDPILAAKLRPMLAELVDS
jgi:hypothetical protein